MVGMRFAKGRRPKTLNLKNLLVFEILRRILGLIFNIQNEGLRSQILRDMICLIGLKQKINIFSISNDGLFTFASCKLEQ